MKQYKSNVYLETTRLYLRPFQLEDMPAYQAHILDDSAVMATISLGRPRHKQRATTIFGAIQSHWRAHHYGLWGVWLRPEAIQATTSEAAATPRFIGQAGLQRVKFGEGRYTQITYAIASAAWGQGYATEAARACLGFAFGQADLPQVIGVTHADNLASQRVLAKLGMRPIVLAGLDSAEVRGFSLSQADYLAAQA